MTNQNSDDVETNPNRLIGKLAYQIGVIHEKLKEIKDQLTMGVYKDALIKTNEAIKYMESKIIPESYLAQGEVEANEPPSETVAP